MYKCIIYLTRGLNGPTLLCADQMPKFGDSFSEEQQWQEEQFKGERMKALNTTRRTVRLSCGESNSRRCENCL